MSSVPMPRQTNPSQSLFRPHRYPALLAIVEADADKLQTLSDKVGEKILKQIISGDMPVGTALNTTTLSESLGVSRTPLAKALTKLTNDGILVQPKKQSAIVSPAAERWLEQTRELRQLLEPEAASRATGHIDEETLHDLWALSREATPTKNYEWKAAAVFFDAALHLSIAEFCGNLPMKVAIRKCWSYKRLTYHLSSKSQAKLKKDYEHHVQILASVASGSPHETRKLMAEHLKAASKNAPLVRAAHLA